MGRSIVEHMEASQNIEMRSGKWDIDNWTHRAPWLAPHAICCLLLDLTEWRRKVQRLCSKWHAESRRSKDRSSKCISEAKTLHGLMWCGSMLVLCATSSKKGQWKKSIMWCHPWQHAFTERGGAGGGHVLWHIVVSNQSCEGESSICTHTHSQTIFYIAKLNCLPLLKPQHWQNSFTLHTRPISTAPEKGLLHPLSFCRRG